MCVRVREIEINKPDETDHIVYCDSETITENMTYMHTKPNKQLRGQRSTWFSGPRGSVCLLILTTDRL